MFGKRLPAGLHPAATFRPTRPMPGDPQPKLNANDRLSRIINPNLYQHHRRVHQDAKK